MKKWCLLVLLCTGCVSAENTLERRMSHKVIEVNGECFVVVVIVGSSGGGATGVAMSPVACVAEE